MARLADIASRIKDQYYQNFKSDEDFFEDDDFKYWAGVVYAKILEQAYVDARADTKSEDGISQVNFLGDWVHKEALEFKHEKNSGLYVAGIKAPIFTFPHDRRGYGLQDLKSNEGIDFIRTSITVAWRLARMPSTSKSFFYYEEPKIFVRSPREIKEAVASVVPDVTSDYWGDEGGPVPASKALDIATMTYNFMANARKGVVVDTTNNSNSNKAMETEIDKAFNGLKTKPI